MPAVGVDAKGDITVVWTTYGQDNAKDGNPGIRDYGIYARIYNASTSATGLAGTNTGEFRVNATTLGNQVAPAVGQRQLDNDAIIAWVGPDTTTPAAPQFSPRYRSAEHGGGRHVPVTPSISVANASVSVGASATQATFTVTLSSATANPVTVNYATANGTARPAPTTRRRPARCTLQPIRRRQTVTVNIAGMRHGGIGPTRPSL